MIRDALNRILELQSEYSPKNTDAMQERKALLSRTFQHWTEENLELIQPSQRVDDLSVESSDGAGNKARVPWLRVYSKSKSPSAPIGWYVVFLFSPEGDAIYLTIGHGSTEIFENAQGKHFARIREPEEMTALVKWGREKLKDFTSIDSRLNATIDMRSPKGSLGKAYEDTTLFAFKYTLNAVPDDNVLISDLNQLVNQLQKLYLEEEVDPTLPGSQTPESVAATAAIDEAAGKSDYKRKARHSYGLSAKEKRAIEEHAVKAAVLHFQGAGWTVKDVGATHSYDLECIAGEEKLYVEVKGTTSHGESVVLTRNEVALHRAEYPSNALFVLRRIVLTKGEEPSASGGEAQVMQPWQIDDLRLNPIGYDYFL